VLEKYILIFCHYFDTLGNVLHLKNYYCHRRACANRLAHAAYRPQQKARIGHRVEHSDTTCSRRLLIRVGSDTTCSEQDWEILQLTSVTQPAAIHDLPGSTRCLRGRPAAAIAPAVVPAHGSRACSTTTTLCSVMFSTAVQHGRRSGCADHALRVLGSREGRVSRRLRRARARQGTGDGRGCRRGGGGARRWTW